MPKPDKEGNYWLRTVAGEYLGYVKKAADGPLKGRWLAYTCPTGTWGAGIRFGSAPTKGAAQQLVRDHPRPDPMGKKANPAKDLPILHNALKSFFG